MMPVVFHGGLAHELRLAAFEDHPETVGGHGGGAQTEEGGAQGGGTGDAEPQEAHEGSEETDDDEQDSPAGGGHGVLAHFLGQGAQGGLDLAGDVGALGDEDQEKNEIEHQESWRAVDPSKKYDTIDVADPDNPDKIEKKIIKIEAYNQKHGVWKYYQLGSVKTETYVFDSLFNPLAVTNKPITSAKDSTQQKPAVAKPKQVEEFDKKNAKKKSIKIRDGRTGN